MIASTTKTFQPECQAKVKKKFKGLIKVIKDVIQNEDNAPKIQAQPEYCSVSLEGQVIFISLCFLCF